MNISNWKSSKSQRREERERERESAGVQFRCAGHGEREGRVFEPEENAAEVAGGRRSKRKRSPTSRGNAANEGESRIRIRIRCRCR